KYVRFPFKREEIFKKWMEMVGQDNFKPKKHSVICSDHFTPNDYEIRPGAYKPRLKECAIPLRCNNNENGKITTVQIPESDIQKN
ncbi:THAP domain-containing protein 3, partial [Trachymyrmex cornetzi]